MGTAPPTGPMREKPRLKLVGEWRRKMFEPGVGVTHGGKLYRCIAATHGEPRQDTASWKEVA